MLSRYRLMPSITKGLFNYHRCLTDSLQHTINAKFRNNNPNKYMGKWGHGKENTYMFNLLAEKKQDDKYTKTWFDRIDLKSSIRPINDVVYKFLDASNETNDIEDPKFNDLITDLIVTLPELPIEQVVKVLEGFTLWQDTYSPNTKNFSNLWSKLDERLTKDLATKKTLSESEVKEALEISLLWYLKGFGRMAKFNKTLTAKIVDLNIKLDDASFLHFLFLVGLRRVMLNNNMIDYITRELKGKISKFNIKEMVIVALVFFKTGTKITDITLNQKMNYIANDNINKVLNDEIDLTALICIIKLLKTNHINTMNDRTALDPFFNKIIKRVDDLDLMTLIYLNSLQFSRFMFKETLVIRTFDKVAENVENMRLKDICRFVYIYAQYMCYTPEMKEQLQTIIEVIEKKKNEIDAYPQELVQFLLGLSILNIYPSSLIEKCMSENFLHTLEELTKRYNCFRRAILTLDTAIMLETNEPRLPENRRLQYTSQIRNLNNYSKVKNLEQSLGSFNESLQRRLYFALKNIYGPEIKVLYILPSFQIPDIILENKSGKLVQLKQIKDLKPNCLSGLSSYTIKTRNQLFSEKEDRFCGLQVLKLRLLDKLGLSVNSINYLDIEERNSNELEEYLKCNKKNKLIREV